MSEDKDSKAFNVDTASNNKSNGSVHENLSLLKESVFLEIKNNFPTLPDTKGERWNLSKVWKYIEDYPQSVVFIPKKELHTLPVVIEQYKRFSNEFSNAKSNHEYLDVVEKHEMEHVKVQWEIDSDSIDGVGIVTYRRGEIPVFGGFFSRVGKLSKSDNLRTYLAPSILSKGDLEYAFRDLLKDTSVKEFISDITDKNTLYIISTQLLPKAAKVFGQRAIDKIKDSRLGKVEDMI